MTPVLAQIRYGHIVVIMEDDNHKQHAIGLDASFNQVTTGDYGDVLRKVKELDVELPKKDRPKPLSNTPKVEAKK